MAEKDNEYQKFFKSAMKKFDIESPDDFKSDSDRKKFFDYIDKNWKGKNESVTKKNSLILRNSDRLNSKWNKKMNKLTENKLRTVIRKMVKEAIAKQKLREGIEDNPDIAAAIYWFSYHYAAGMGNLYRARTKTGYKPSRLANNVEYEDSIVQDMYQELVDTFENDDPTYEEMLQVLEPYDDGVY